MITNFSYDEHNSAKKFDLLAKVTFWNASFWWKL